MNNATRSLSLAFALLFLISLFPGSISLAAPMSVDTSVSEASADVTVDLLGESNADTAGVKANLISIDVAPASAILVPGETVTATATAIPSANSVSQLIWISEDTNIATVAQDASNPFKATVTALSSGETFILAYDFATEIYGYIYIYVSPYLLNQSFYYGWTDEATATDWTTYDADGDEICWDLVTRQQGFAGCGENDLISCASPTYDINNYAWLTPDDWLISPPFKLTDICSISWFSTAQDPDYAEHNYAVYLGGPNASEPDDFTIELFDGTTKDSWSRNAADIGKYIGRFPNGARVAFRHYNAKVDKSFYMKLDDIQLTYTIPYYNVRFYDYDGSLIQNSKVVKGGDATPPENPMHDGMSFAGWSGDYKNVTEDRNIYAIYATTYLVTFYDWDGTILKEANTVEGANALPPEDPFREGYQFAGWEGSYVNVTENRDVYATYVKLHIVTFLDWDDTTLKVTRVRDGGDATPPRDPSRDGYTFTGWDKPYTNITEDTTIYAQYSSGSATPTPTGGTPSGTPEGEGSNGQTHYVTFLDYDYTYITDVAVVDRFNAVPPPDPTRAGYVFTGWDGSYLCVTENRTLIATYALEGTVTPTPPPTGSDVPEGQGSNGQTHYVTFLDWDYSYITDVAVVDRYHAVPPANPTRAGYNFTGWSGSYLYVTENRTLNAMYEKIGATPTPTPTPTNAPTPTPPTTPEGQGSNGQTYYVTFLDWDYTFIASVAVVDMYHAELPADPVREGYMFAGWTGGSYQYVTENRTLVASYALYGDINSDDRFNTGDAVHLLRYSAGLITLRPSEMLVADVTGDGKINTGDVVAILRKCAL